MANVPARSLTGRDARIELSMRLFIARTKKILIQETVKRKMQTLFIVQARFWDGSVSLLLTRQGGGDGDTVIELKLLKFAV